jgi:hypothetical protein
MNTKRILIALSVILAAFLISAEDQTNPTNPDLWTSAPAAVAMQDTVAESGTIAFNTGALKQDYKAIVHIEHVKTSGTVTAAVVIQGSNLPTSLALWDDLHTLSFAATGDTTITLTNVPNYLRVSVSKSTGSGNWVTSTRAATKFAVQ